MWMNSKTHEEANEDSVLFTIGDKGAVYGVTSTCSLTGVDRTARGPHPTQSGIDNSTS